MHTGLLAWVHRHVIGETPEVAEKKALVEEVKEKSEQLDGATADLSHQIKVLELKRTHRHAAINKILDGVTDLTKDPEGKAKRLP